MNHEYSLCYKNVCLRPISRHDTELLRKWRNDPNNSLYLRQIPYITYKAQMEWYRKYLTNKNELFFGIVENDVLNRLVGSLSLYNISNDSCFFGRILIGDAEAHGRKIGLNATIAALKIAFEIIELEKVFLHVYSDNASAIKIYIEAGFKIVDTHTSDEGKIEYLMVKTRGKNMNKMDEVKMLEFTQRGDERGHLVIIEGLKDVPFEIKRAFYIYGSDKNVVRGQHANKESEFVLINVAGQSKVKVKDGKGNEKVFFLDRPHIGIYLPTMIWKDMYDFSEDSVLLVLASTHYNANEYIRNYDDFTKIMKDK